MQKRCQHSKSEEISKIVQSAVIRERKTGKPRGQRAERDWGRGKRGKSVGRLQATMIFSSLLFPSFEICLLSSLQPISASPCSVWDIRMMSSAIGRHLLLLPR